jgi:hypothetical protein
MTGNRCNLMNALSVAVVSGAALLAASLWGCGGANASMVDPQQPALSQPGAPKGAPLRPAQIVICPDGSSYDPTHNQCVATSPLTPPAPTAPTKPARPSGSGSVAVRCAFRDGWVSVLPVDAYPSDDSFLMQALIGLSDEPSFWQSQSEYADLEPYAARKCTDQQQRFEVDAGDYFVLVGEANTFQRRGRYDRNGYRRRMHVSPGAPTDLTVRESDLTLTFNCISCPFVSFVDGATNRFLPAFVVLAYRNSPARRGTDRVKVRSVPVSNGRIRLRVAEADHEVSHLDQLVIEVAGNRLAPLPGGSQSALAQSDGVGVQMRRGTQITVEYEVAGMRDGAVDVEVVASGYYEPTE